MSESGSLVDADSLLAVTARLRTLRELLADVDATEEQRRRWQRTLGAIAQGAAADLERAGGQLRRLAAQVERVRSDG